MTDDPGLDVIRSRLARFAPPDPDPTRWSLAAVRRRGRRRRQRRLAGAAVLALLPLLWTVLRVASPPAPPSDAPTVADQVAVDSDVAPGYVTPPESPAPDEQPVAYSDPAAIRRLLARHARDLAAGAVEIEKRGPSLAVTGIGPIGSHPARLVARISTDVTGIAVLRARLEAGGGVELRALVTRP